MIDKKSWKVILDMAKAGDPTAMVEAGDYFADGYEDTTEGIIVKQDEKKAFKMYYNAAALMDTEGISRMALCLSEGIGCKQDIEGAIVVYKQALEMGDSIAAYNLGTIYRDQGKYKKAFKHYKVAMQLDHADYSFNWCCWTCPCRGRAVKKRWSNCARLIRRRALFCRRVTIKWKWRAVLPMPGTAASFKNPTMTLP